MNADDVKVEAVQLEGTNVDDLAGLVRITIVAEDLDSLEISELIERSISVLRKRLSPEAIQKVESNLTGAVEAAVQTADEENLAETDEEDDAGTDAPLLEEGRSYLLDFYSELRGAQQGLLPLGSEVKFRQVLYSLL